MYSICTEEGTWEKIITQLSYIGKIFLQSKPCSAPTIHDTKNLSPPTDKTICSLIIIISTPLNTVLILALNLREIQMAISLQIFIFVLCIFRSSHGKQILYNVMHFKKSLSLQVIPRDSCIKPVSIVIESFPWSDLMITPFISITLRDNHFS